MANILKRVRFYQPYYQVVKKKRISFEMFTISFLPIRFLWKFAQLIFKLISSERGQILIQDLTFDLMIWPKMDSTVRFHGT